MSGREITYNCPACEMVFFGPFTVCHMCGYSKIEAARRRELARIAEQIQDLTAELKADNDAFDFAEERRQVALENARIDDAEQKRERESVWDAQDRLVDDAYSAIINWEE